MKRMAVFAGRCFREILRDPLSYLFCLGFPLAMLGIMTLVNESIPPEAGLTIFRLGNLSAGVAVFSLTFTMLFAALLISRDRSSAFLTRLFLSPMRAPEYIGGYLLPLFCIAVGQCLITWIAALVISLVSGSAVSVVGMLIATLFLIPSILFFCALGVLLGTLFTDRTAPPLSSILISAASLLGGIWMDIDALGGVYARVCHVLPFYHSVRLCRAAVNGTLGKDAWISLAVTAGYALAVTIAASLAFRRQMTAQ